MQQTSLAAFEFIQPEISASQRIVYDEIADNPDITNAELADSLGWRINCVTPRVLELRQKGMVKHLKTRECKITQHGAMAWYALSRDKELLWKEQ